VIVLVGGRRCTNTVWFSPYKLECDIPHGVGAGLDVVVLAGGLLSPPGNAFFSYEKPGMNVYIFTYLIHVYI
jgi:hypothetical protein